MNNDSSIRLELDTDLAGLAVLEETVNQVLAPVADLQDAEAVRYNIWLSIHELCVNIIKHAYAGEAGKFMLTLSLLDDPWRVEVSTCDHGRRQFDSAGWTPPDLDDLPVHGLGIFLIQNLMDEVSYAPGADCNRWHLTKRLELAGGGQASTAASHPLHQNTPYEARA